MADAGLQAPVDDGTPAARYVSISLRYVVHLYFFKREHNLQWK